MTLADQLREVLTPLLGDVTVEGMTVTVIDPVADYAALMERLFDFPAIRALFAGGFTMRFDAMHAVSTPGVLDDREVLRSALAVCLVKDRRDLPAFERVFDRFR